MTGCAFCGRPVGEGEVKCAGCGTALHRECAKKLLGKFYCKGCLRKGKKQAKYERMRQWSTPGR